MSKKQKANKALALALVEATTKKQEAMTSPKYKTGQQRPEALDVVAKWICGTQVCYDCDFCWTQMKTDGSPYKNAERAQHAHVWAGGTEDGVIHVPSTCHGGLFPHWAYAGVNIHVTKDTKRTTSYDRICYSTRRFALNLELCNKRLLKLYPLQEKEEKVEKKEPTVLHSIMESLAKKGLAKSWSEMSSTTSNGVTVFTHDKKRVPKRKRTLK